MEYRVSIRKSKWDRCAIGRVGWRGCQLDRQMEVSQVGWDRVLIGQEDGGVTGGVGQAADCMGRWEHG